LRKTGDNNNHKAPQSVQPGEPTNPQGRPLANTILLSIPDDELAVIRPHLRFVSLEHHHVLHEPRQTLQSAYFLNSGMISLVMVTRQKESVEVGVVGSEGFIPLQMMAGLKRTPHRVVVQISGDASKIGIDRLQEMLPSLPKLQAALNHYAGVHALQVAQTAGCNRLHDLDQRLCRWLLLTQDRVGSGLLRITHDFLATMLGTDRPSVSLAAGDLQRKQIIEYSHGSVRILNRKKLETAACECYRVIQQFDGNLALK